MSNPYITKGEDIPLHQGGMDKIRTFVSTISFNDDDIQFLNAEELEDFSSTNGRTTVFLASMRQTHSSTESAKNHVPPFIEKDTWTKEDLGLMYNSSMSILSNGTLIPTPIIPNREEFINNQMEYDLDKPGIAGADKKNTRWTWRARKITKNEQKIIYGDFLEKGYFDTNWTRENNAKPWVVTEASKGASQIRINSNPEASIDSGISLELDLKDKKIAKKYGYQNEEDAGDEGAKFFNTDGTMKDARLGSFMLILDLQPDQKNSGEDSSKRPPWEVRLRMGKSVDAKDNLDDATWITVNISKGNMVTVSVFGEKTQFNLPAPPAATNAQSAGEQNPNSMALSFIPVLNGILLSVGNYNGLDKTVSDRMSKFCKSNPNFNVMAYYKNTYDVNYDPENPTEFEDDTDPLLGEGTQAGPSMQIDTSTDDKNPGKNGLIPIGDRLGVDIFNAVGSISYIPLFFQPYTNAALVQPISTDATTLNITGIDYIYWPTYCKNGMQAVLEKTSTEVGTYVVDNIQAPIDTYSRNPTATGGIVTINLIGQNPFVAGDSVKVEDSAVSGSFTITTSSGSTIQGAVSDDSLASGSGGVVKLQGSRSGTVAVFGVRIRSGFVKEYSSDEDSTDIATRYNAIMGRYNESLYARYPVLLYGATRVQREELDLTTIHNKNKPDFDLGDQWINCITNITVSHALDGSSGNITLDRYALNQIYGNNSDFAFQQIGQLSFDVNLGDSSYDTDGSKTYAFRLGRNSDQATSGILLRGFGYGFGIEQSSGGANLNIPIFGINKKLEEMKLYNSPYFDGETVLKTIDFFTAWGNVEPVFDYTNPDEKLTSSSVLGEVRHEFKMGTPLWDALQTVAEDTANSIVVQPDGRLYIYKLNQYGEPEHDNFEPKNWKYPTARVTNLSRNPDFSQFYNKIIVTALQNNAAAGMGNGANNANPVDFGINTDDLPIFPIAVGVDLTQQTIPYIPWEKLVVKPLESFWTQQSLQKHARVIAKQALSIHYTGSTTIPGNLGINLWDKFNDRYWIQGITHNYDATTKKLSTELTLATLHPIGDLSFDSNDIPSITIPSGDIEPYEP